MIEISKRGAPTICIRDEHLVDGEVAVLFEVGAEKLRYVLGSAVAVRSDGKVLQLHLNEIYQMIFEEWGVTTNAAEY